MSNLLINEPPLQVLPSLAMAIGLNEAVILQQIHYWLAHGKMRYEGRIWIYKPVSRWQEQDFPFWSEKTIRTAIKNLRDMDLVLVKQLNDNKQVRVNYYTINYEELRKISKKTLEILYSYHVVNITECIWQYLPLPFGKSYHFHSVKLTACILTELPNVKENKQEKTEETKKESTKEKQAPFNFSANEDQLAKMHKYGLNPDLSIETFLAEAKADGKKYHCWESALTIWLNKLIADNNLRPLDDRINDRLKAMSKPEAVKSDNQNGYHPSHQPADQVTNTVIPSADPNWHWKDPLPGMSIPDTYKCLDNNRQAGESKRQAYDRLHAELSEKVS